METPRLTPETSSDVPGKKETTKKKKKAGTALGALIVEPKSQKFGNKAGGESFWRQSSKEELSSKPEADQKASKNTDASSDYEHVDAHEARDLPEIDAEEKVYAEQELVQFKMEQASEDSDQLQEVTRFRQRIVGQGLDSDAALAVTLAEIEQQANEEEISTSETGSDDDENTVSTTNASTTDAPIIGANGGGGNNRPPTPPTASGANQPPNEPTPARGRGAFAPLVAEPETYNRAFASNKKPTPVEYISNDNNSAADLVGGIIGYLIGRRRGRKKTEKKLLPIQRKLEKEVSDLQWQLQAKESKIREAVRQNQSIQQRAVVPAPIRLGPARQPSAEKVLEQPFRHAAPEATQLHGKKHTSEQIGHMLVAAEAHDISKHHAPNIAEKQRPRDVLSPKNIKTLNRVELLAVSERIIIEGTSLRQIYETHLVGERGLRRLVAEYVRGGNLKKVLREEIVEREIDFERDPVLSDSQSTSTYLEPAGTAAPALQNLLQKIDANMNTEKDEVAFLKARADYEAKAQVQQQKHRHLVDATFGTAILVLVVLVAVLVMTRQ